MITVMLRYWQPIALAAVVLALLAYVYGMGRSHESREWEAKFLEQQQAYDVVHLEARNALDKLEMETNARIMNARALAAARSQKTDVQIREVKVWRTKYRENPDAGTCKLPNGFVLAHNAAATNRVPDGDTSANSEGISRFTDAELEDVMADNYALYHQCVDAVKEYDDYYHAVAGAPP